MNNIKAKVLTNENPFPKEQTDLVIGKFYDVDDIDMGQSYTYIYLKDKPDKTYNSVMFEFYENGKEIDIYSDERFNPYLKLLEN